MIRGIILSIKKALKHLRKVAGLELGHLIRRQASALLDQQLWCLGRDVLVEGNLLVRFGFERNPPPPHLEARSSFYRHGPLTAWGWGLAWTIPHWGSIFVKRYDFKPLYIKSEALSLWRLDDLPLCAPLPCEATALHALVDLAQFWANYERWVTACCPSSYRPAVIAANPNQQTRSIPAEEFADRWAALSEDLSRLVQSMPEPPGWPAKLDLSEGSTT